MRKIVLFLLVFLSYSVNAQMVPSFLGVYDGKYSFTTRKQRKLDCWDYGLGEKEADAH